MSTTPPARDATVSAEPEWIPSTLGRELEETFVRRALYRYGFEDVTNQIPWLARFVAGAFRTDWRGQYEGGLAQAAQVRHASSFAAGRMALFAVLKALGIGTGDEVILPAYTCVVVPNAILYLGARPVYVDVTSDDFNLNIDQLEQAITSRTRAIIAQHTFGQPAEIDAIREIARTRGLAVIEDVAHAIGGTSLGRPLGSLGDAAFGSTDHSKIFSTSLGGFALSDSPAIQEGLQRMHASAAGLSATARARIVFQYGARGLAARPRLHWLTRMPVEQLARVGVWYYLNDELKLNRPDRYPAVLPNFSAFIGVQELRNLASNITHRRFVAARYREILQGVTGPLPEGAFLRYSLLVRSPMRWEHTLGRYFTIGRWFSSVTQGRSTDFDQIAYAPGSCPTAEHVSAHIINFPTHAGVDEGALEKFEGLVRRFRLTNDILST